MSSPGAIPRTPRSAKKYNLSPFVMQAMNALELDSLDDVPQLRTSIKTKEDLNILILHAGKKAQKADRERALLSPTPNDEVDPYPYDNIEKIRGITWMMGDEGRSVKENFLRFFVDFE